jgi:hypothetical protein
LIPPGTSIIEKHARGARAPTLPVGLHRHAKIRPARVALRAVRAAAPAQRRRTQAATPCPTPR